MAWFASLCSRTCRFGAHLETQTDPPLALHPVGDEQRVGVAPALVVEIAPEQLQPLHSAGGQGLGQIIQFEPAHVQAFLVPHIRLGIAAGLESAQERVVHVHRVVAVRIGDHA